MLDFHAVSSGLALLFSDPTIWWMMVGGLFVGLVGGAIPGISGTMTMALFMPLTMYMQFMPAVLFLTAIFTGANYGGGITSTILGIPGTPSAVATTFDGYPMARKGLHNEALGLGMMACISGVLFGYVILLFLIAPLASFALKLGPPAMLMVALWGLTMISSLGGRHSSRGLMAGVFGLLLGTVGMNTSGYVRGTMGISVLLEGVPVVAAMMGMFAASQLFTMVGATFLVKDDSLRRANYTRVLAGCAQVWRYPLLQLRSNLIGVVIGIIPGVGASIANLISYAQAKRYDRDGGASFGKGNPKGVIASEAAASSSEGGSMITMLALGIPGSGGTAVLLAAFALHNVISGPQFITRHMDVVYMIVFGNFIIAFLLLFVSLAFLSVAGNIVRVSLPVLIPSVLVLAVMGSFAIAGDWAGPVALLVFAILGWLMKRYDYPVAACVIGLLLGRLVESETIRTWELSGGHPVLLMLHKPAALVFLVLLVLSLVLPVISRRLPLWRTRKAAAAP